MWLHESNRKFHTDGTLHSKCPSVRYPGLGGAVPRTCRAERVNAVPAPVPGAAPSLMDQAKAAPDSSIKEAKAEAGQPFTSASKETTEGNNQTKPAGPPPLSLASIISSLRAFQSDGRKASHFSLSKLGYCSFNFSLLNIGKLLFKGEPSSRISVLTTFVPMSAHYNNQNNSYL